MDFLTDVVVPIVVVLIAAVPFQTLVQHRIKMQAREDAMAKLVKGTAYMTILTACDKYDSQGWIANADREILMRHLVEPYLECGFNGTAQQRIQEIKDLPSRSEFLNSHLK